MKMSNRDELKEASNRLKSSIEGQFDEVGEKLEKAGKIGLMVGGGVLALLLISQLFASKQESTEEPSDEEPPKKKKKQKIHYQASQSSFLTDSLKEQAILFALGLAAKQLNKFLSELKKTDEQKDSERY